MHPFILTTYDKDDDRPVPWRRLVWIATRLELIAEMLRAINGQHRICHADPA